MIDLHSHTTASDGLLDADSLVREAWLAGVRVLAVTDHDTVGALVAARRAAAGFGLTLVDGIEVTAVESGRDVHVLGYFFDPESQALLECLETQRAARRDRLRVIAGRLADCGVPVDIEPLLASTSSAKALGRPALAQALIAAGHVRSTREAFDRWLGDGCPAWAERDGIPVRDVASVIHGAGGLVSLAHPGLYGRDAEIERWRDDGLDALEVYHSEHSPEAIERYLALADRLGLLVTGGSDFHGDPPSPATRGRSRVLGRVSLPEAAFERLQQARPNNRS